MGTTTLTDQTVCQTCQRPGCIGLSCNLDLALAKAKAGAALTLPHRKLVALELARRAVLADTDVPTCGDEWQLLRTVADSRSVVSAFLELVQAYADWHACTDDVDGWRNEVPRPMSSDAAFEYVQTQLDDALNSLLGIAS